MRSEWEIKEGIKKISAQLSENSSNMLQKEIDELHEWIEALKWVLGEDIRY